MSLLCVLLICLPFLHEGRNVCLLDSLLYPKILEYCMTQSKGSINIYGVNEKCSQDATLKRRQWENMCSWWGREPWRWLQGGVWKKEPRLHCGWTNKRESRGRGQGSQGPDGIGSVVVLRLLLRVNFQGKPLGVSEQSWIVIVYMLLKGFLCLATLLRIDCRRQGQEWEKHLGGGCNNPGGRWPLLGQADGGKWLDSVHILKIELIGFTERLDVEGERKKEVQGDFKAFDLSSWLDIDASDWDVKGGILWRMEKSVENQHCSAQFWFWRSKQSTFLVLIDFPKSSSNLCCGLTSRLCESPKGCHPLRTPNITTPEPF